MKQNKNDDLQSRRQFFKNAAKNALPILGGILLLNLPLSSIASNRATDCNYGCSGSCEGSCSDVCANSCSGGCYNSCVGSCSTGCRNTCEGQSSKYY